MWDRHLLQLLHLGWEEGHTGGQGWANSSASISKGLVAVQACKDTWLPQAACLDFLNTSWTEPGVRGPGAAGSARAGNQAELCQSQGSVLRLGTAREGPDVEWAERTPESYCGRGSWTPGIEPSPGTGLSLQLVKARA